MKKMIIDSNVLLDIFTEDPGWFEWSSLMLEKYSQTHTFVINPIIYGEISLGFQKIQELEKALPSEYFQREDVPYEAAFLAAKCFQKYRKRGGKKTSTLPDFYIGAHAVISNMNVLTRDKGRYESYFPELEIIQPS